jgi:hypothetical protein
MQVPFNMTTPRMKLDDGEEILLTVPGLRRKGIFGSRFGELHLTTKRLAFVKAIMKSGLISAAAGAKGARPMLELSRAAITGVEKVPHKKQVALVVTAGGVTEKFLLDAGAIDALLPALQPRG